MKNISTLFMYLSFSIDIIHNCFSAFKNTNTINQFIYSIIILLVNLLLLLHIKNKLHIFLFYFIINIYSLYNSILSKKLYIQNLPQDQSNHLFLTIFLFNTTIVKNPKKSIYLFTKLFTEFSAIITNILKSICTLISLILYIINTKTNNLK